MKSGYVSIIVPCYNAAATLGRFMDSVMNQTYSYIQVIAINDGSTDQTAEILKNYKAKFVTSEREFIIITQKNLGLGSAINSGLKHIQGEYICWADPDDFYMKDSVEKRVAILKSNPDYGAVSSDAYYYDEDNLERPVGRASDGLRNCNSSYQFELLLEEASIFCPGCHMVRYSVMEEVNPKFYIYPARRGQNWQLLLPVYYKYKRYFLNEPLYGYVRYSDSMSNGDNSEEKLMYRLEEHEKIILETLDGMSMQEKEREKYKNKIRCRYTLKRFYAAIDHRDYKRVREEYSNIKTMQCNTIAIDKLYKQNKSLCAKVIYKIWHFR